MILTLVFRYQLSSCENIFISIHESSSLFASKGTPMSVNIGANKYSNIMVGKDGRTSLINLDCETEAMLCDFIKHLECEYGFL